MRNDYQSIVASAIREEVRRLSVHHGIESVPVSIERFISMHGWRIFGKPLPRGFHGAALYSVHKVLVNSHQNLASRRFALAHELVHMLCHEEYQPGLRCLSDPDRMLEGYVLEMEVEANSGGAELLLPYTWFQQRARQLLGRPLGSSDELDYFLSLPDAKEWADEAQVSVAILKYHLIDLGWIDTTTIIV